MELHELTDLTVDEQKDELENLTAEKLRELKETEERNTALDNIKRELRNRKTNEDNQPRGEPIPENNSSPEDPANHSEEQMQKDRLAELERKVDYIIQSCKTTSTEGYENHKEEN